jgi:hypothetical protein
MGKRRPERDEAKKLWQESHGTMKPKEIGEKLGVTAKQVSNWKRLDNWQLKNPRGAPKGNTNAKGHGAPKGNTNAKGHKNAETHGAYSEPDTDNFSEEDWRKIDAASMQSELLAELMAKRIDLRKRIEKIENSRVDAFVTGGINGANSVEYWDSKIKYIQTLELEYNRIVGRILKVFDQLQAAESARIHAELSRESLDLQRQKAMGVFGESDEDA